MTYNELALAFLESHRDNIKFLDTVSVNNSSKELLKKLKDKKGTKGLYFIFKHRSKTNCWYVGQTSNCIIKRIINHLKSLLDPFWKTELTGLMFNAANLPLDSKMDVYYISSEDLAIKTRDEFISAETLFKNALKAKANKHSRRHPK